MCDVPVVNNASTEAERWIEPAARRRATTIEDDNEGVKHTTASSHHDGTTSTDNSASIQPTSSVHHNLDLDPERPRNPTPASVPTFRFKPHTKPPNTTLTQHPLSTPLRITTPAHPILPARTSSLSSPPLYTPTRMGMPPAFAFTFQSAMRLGLPEGPASAPLFATADQRQTQRSEIGGSDSDSHGSSGLMHSPTSSFACIWKRHLCGGGCGRVVGEEVESCICAQRQASMGPVDGRVDSERVAEKLEVICRSTAPVVRYTERVNDVRGWTTETRGPQTAALRCEMCRARS